MQQNLHAETGPRWLSQRSYPDLPDEAERELRLAGLSWHDEPRAETHLANAASLSPGHLAVVVAHYRYHFYKHHYVQARKFAGECLRAVGLTLGLPEDVEAVTSEHADFCGDDPVVRFWLFAMQAYGYVLLRLGETAKGQAILQKITELDRPDNTKTRVLLQVIAASGTDDDD
jgi:hypothetical protein